MEKADKQAHLPYTALFLKNTFYGYGKPFNDYRGGTPLKHWP